MIPTKKPTGAIQQPRHRPNIPVSTGPPKYSPSICSEITKVSSQKSSSRLLIVTSPVALMLIVPLMNWADPT